MIFKNSLKKFNIFIISFHTFISRNHSTLLYNDWYFLKLDENIYEFVYGLQ